MKRIIAILVAATFSSACGTQGTTDASELPLEPSSEHFLVWWAVEEGGYSTALVRADDNGPTVVGEGPGLFIAADASIWSWDERSISTQQTECACLMEAEVSGEDRDCTVAREVTSAELVEVDGTRNLSAFPVQSEYEGEVEANPDVLGSSGPIVMSSDCAYNNFCGAHGSVNCEFKAWNLATGAKLEADQLVDPLSGPDQVGLLNQETRDELVTTEELVGLVEVRPQWSDSGEIRLEALYVASACYACSDGEWSSYTIGARHDRATPRVELEPAPGAVLEIWNTTTGARGWSRLPATEVERVRSLLR